MTKPYGITYSDDANDRYEGDLQSLIGLYVRVRFDMTPESTYDARVLGTHRDDDGLCRVDLQPCNDDADPVGPPLSEDIYYVQLEVL